MDFLSDRNIFVSEEGSQKVDIELFYYNQTKDIDSSCDESYVLPVSRKIERTNTPIKDSLNLLLEGELTEEEKGNGFTTEFPNKDFKLVSANLSEGKLTLSFNEVPSFTSGGSCRVSLLATQLRKTAMQFKEVKEVVFQPDSIFQP
jgi:spore germination protein GerM